MGAGKMVQWVEALDANLCLMHSETTQWELRTDSLQLSVNFYMCKYTFMQIHPEQVSKMFKIIASTGKLKKKKTKQSLNGAVNVVAHSWVSYNPSIWELRQEGHLKFKDSLGDTERYSSQPELLCKKPYKTKCWNMIF